MNKSWILVIASLALSGCITSALRQETVRQGTSTMDTRYREVIENLAMIADNPSALPAYSSIYSGTTDLQDSVMLSPSTTWARNSASVVHFSQQTLDMTASRQIEQNWTLDPTIVPAKLIAMQCACRWMLFGPQYAGDESWMLEKYNSNNPDNTPRVYFDVADQLRAIDACHPCWLRCEARWKDVPKHSRYWAGSHGKYVWVGSDGMPGFSEFVLVMQKIARADMGKILQPQPLIRSVKVTNPRVICSSTTGPKEVVKSVTIYVDEEGNPTSGQDKPLLPLKAWNDNTGQYSDLKSSLAAAAKSL